MRGMGLGMLVLFLPAAAGFCCGDEVVKDLWYIAYGCGKPVGYAHTYVYAFSREGNLLIETQTSSRIRLEQYGLRMDMSAETKILEDSDGRIISLEFRSENDGVVLEAAGTTESGILRVTSTAGGVSATSDIDISGTLGPFAAWKKMEMSGLEQGRVIEYRAFVPQVFRVCDVWVEIKGREVVAAAGGEAGLWRIETAVSGLPYTTVEWCDESCVPKKSFSLAFGGIVFDLSDRETALGILPEP